MTTECPICCSPYNKSTAKCITCPRPDCGESACKKCVSTYLLGNTSDPHCMHCRVGWDHNFLAKNLTMKFLKKDYAEHRKNVLFEREQSRIPDTQNDVIKYRRLQDLKCQNNHLNNEIKEVRERLRALEEEYQNRRHLIYRIETGQEKMKTEQRAFVMPCPEPQCKGYLSSAYKCASCSKYACPHCLVVLGEEKDPNHQCDPDVVATVEQIKKETKGCPKCGERIGKVSGCDQMWCPKCQTAFSWRTGKIETGVIHNPHYFQWARQNSANGVIPRQPGDRPNNNPCGQENINHGFWQEVDRFAKFLHLRYFLDTINSSQRYSRHLNQVTIQENENVIQRCNDHTRQRVQYIIGELSEEDFKSLLQADDIKRKKLIDLNNIYQLFSHAANDIVNNFIAKFTEGLPLDYYGNHIFPKIKHTVKIDQNHLLKGEHLITTTNELQALINYTNNELTKYSATYGATVHIITSDCHPLRGHKFSKISSEDFIKESAIYDECDKVYFKKQQEKYCLDPKRYLMDKREDYTTSVM